MINIRTALVVAAFVAMGLTGVAEHLAEKAQSRSDPFMSVELEEAMPGKVLRLTQKIQPDTETRDPSPWI